MFSVPISPVCKSQFQASMFLLQNSDFGNLPTTALPNFGGKASAPNTLSLPQPALFVMFGNVCLARPLDREHPCKHL
jgi:hypothetical protein